MFNAASLNVVVQQLVTQHGPDSNFAKFALQIQEELLRGISELPLAVGDRVKLNGGKERMTVNAINFQKKLWEVTCVWDHGGSAKYDISALTKLPTTN